LKGDARQLLPELVEVQEETQNSNQGGKKLASQIKLKKEMLVSTAAGGGIQIPKRTDEFQPKENNYT